MLLSIYIVQRDIKLACLYALLLECRIYPFLFYTFAPRRQLLIRWIWLSNIFVRNTHLVCVWVAKTLADKTQDVCLVNSA